MKKIIFTALLAIATNVSAQAPTPSPAPIEPVIAPAGSPAAAVPTSTSASTDTVPTYERPDPVVLNAKLGAGSSFGPQALWITADLEVQLDKFVGIGPKVQYGTKSGTDFFFTSIGPRFIIPFSYFEFGIGTGFGLAYRNVAGFEFSNFLYQAGINWDLYLLKNLSLGLGYNINLISSAAETVMTAATLSVAGHF